MFQIITAHSCFCLLYGTSLEDCPCTADTVDSFNNKLHPDLMRLLQTEYFRYFQVDFNSACSRGWDLQCSSPNCSVEPCDTDSLPETVRDGKQILARPGQEQALVSRLLNWLFQTFPFLEHLLGFDQSLARSCPDPYPEYHDVRRGQVLQAGPPQRGGGLRLGGPRGEPRAVHGL